MFVLDLGCSFSQVIAERLQLNQSVVDLDLSHGPGGAKAYEDRGWEAVAYLSDIF